MHIQSQTARPIAIDAGPTPVAAVRAWLTSGSADEFPYDTVVAEFRRVLMQELDYRREAQNLVLLAKVLSEYPRLVIPQPIDDYTTERVLTMDLVRGQKISALSPVVRLEADGRGLAEELIRAYLHQYYEAQPGVILGQFLIIRTLKKDGTKLVQKVRPVPVARPSCRGFRDVARGTRRRA